MSSRKHRSILFGGASVILLVFLDLWLAWLRRSRKVLERSVLSGLAVALAVTAGISLIALVQITSRISAAVHDATIGIEASRSMRPLISGLHLRVRTADESPLNISDVERDGREFDRLYLSFREGIAMQSKNVDLDEIRVAADVYFSSVRSVVRKGGMLAIADWERLDREEQKLLKLLGEAIDVNIRMLRGAVAETSESATLALRLAWGLGAVVVTVLFLILVLQVLAQWIGHGDVLPED